MRNCYLLLLFCFSFSLAAQYEKGTWYLDVNNQVQVVNTNFGFGDLLESRLTGGFFLKNNLLVGAQLELGTLFGEGLNTSTHQVVPFVRYYFPAAQQRKLRWFAEAGAGLQFESNLQANVQLGAGAEYQIAPGIFATADLRYRSEVDRQLGGFSFNLGLNVRLGDAETENGPLVAGQKGSFLLDGTFGSVSRSQLRTFDVFSAGLAVRGGYFLTDNLLLEGGASIYASSVDSDSEIGFESDLFGFSAQVGTSYLFNTGKRFRPYLAGGLRYDNSEQDSRQVINDEPRIFLFSDQGLSAYGRAGFLHQLNSRLALDVYFGTHLRLTGEGRDNQLSGGAGLKVFLGKE
ncbi:MAG: outer membrane beta-barrel protein [Bacteroidota bacterium]